MTTALTCHDLTKVYGTGPLVEAVLTAVSLSFRRGERCVLLGPSGSGKTTLLSILGCLLTPTSGAVEIDGVRVDFSRPADLVRLRKERIGFVFQHAQLLPFLSVRENLDLVAQNARLPGGERARRISGVLDQLGIASFAKRKPSELSGGQRQRVAVARAVLLRPRTILADEPTAALDWENGQTAVQLLLSQARADDALLIVVTHDTRLLSWFDRVIELASGRVRAA